MKSNKKQAQTGKQFFIMTRKGVFKAKKSTDNQCKVRGHNSYNYTIKILVEGVRESLDLNDFIIDHVDLDQFIQKAGLKGSCEGMHLQISTKLPKFLAERGVNLLGFCSKIVPVGNDVMAFMEYTKVMDGDKSLLPMLTIN